jgi:hypothetical protein
MTQRVAKTPQNRPTFLAAATGSEQVGIPEQGDPPDRRNVPGPALRVERDRVTRASVLGSQKVTGRP